MKNINNHIDSGCPSPTPSEIQSTMSPKGKGKQKQEWTKIFSGDSVGASGLKKAKSKAR
jgi:E3 ubiquitin-protein ligase RAD18